MLVSYVSFLIEDLMTSLDERNGCLNSRVEKWMLPSLLVFVLCQIRHVKHRTPILVNFGQLWSTMVSICQYRLVVVNIGQHCSTLVNSITFCQFWSTRSTPTVGCGGCILRTDFTLKTSCRQN